jgi:hypothetical protein
MPFCRGCGDLSYGSYNCGCCDDSDQSYISDNRSKGWDEPDSDYYFSDDEEEKDVELVRGDEAEHNSSSCSICRKDIPDGKNYCGACGIIKARVEEKDIGQRISHRIRASFVPLFSSIIPILIVVFNHGCNVGTIRSQIPVLEYLLSNGADPNLKYKNKTVLDLVIDELERYAFGTNRHTPKLYFQLNFTIEFAKILVSHGAVASHMSQYSIQRIQNNLTFIKLELKFFEVGEFEDLLDSMLRQIKDLESKAGSGVKGVSRAEDSRVQGIFKRFPKRNANSSSSASARAEK